MATPSQAPMTIGEVKGKLKALGVDLTGVIEKEELIKLARQHGVLKKVAAPKKADANAATPAARQTPKVNMKQLKASLVAAGVKVPEGIEAKDLLTLARIHNVSTAPKATKAKVAKGGGEKKASPGQPRAAKPAKTKTPAESKKAQGGGQKKAPTQKKQEVEMARPAAVEPAGGDNSLVDCRYFLKNGVCTNKACSYRHFVVAFTNHAAGKKCNKWPNCSDAKCPYPHISGPATTKTIPDNEGPKKAVAAPSQPQKQPKPFIKPVAGHQGGGTKRVACLWDIENCAIPRGVTASSLVQALRHQVGIGSPGVAEIGFTCFGDVDNVPREQRIALKRANVRMVDTADSKKGSADRAIEKELDLLALTHQPPLLVVLITGDIDYVQQINRLRYTNGFQIVIFHNKQARAELIQSAHQAFKWEDISYIAKDLVTADHKKNPNATKTKGGPSSTSQQGGAAADSASRNKATKDSESKSIEKPEKKAQNKTKTESSQEVKETNSEKAHVCVVCSKGFQSESSLDQHKASSGHEGVKCTVCQAGPFSTMAALQQHQSSKKHLPCPSCSDSFATPQALAQHEKDKHTSGPVAEKKSAPPKSELKFACGACPRAFATGVALQNHQERMKHFTCPTCSKAFASGAALDQHQVDLEHIVVVCPVCNAGPFKSERGVLQHQRDKGHLYCTECRGTYATEADLEDHLVATGHMGEDSDSDSDAEPESEPSQTAADRDAESKKKAILAIFSGLAGLISRYQGSQPEARLATQSKPARSADVPASAQPEHDDDAIVSADDAVVIADDENIESDGTQGESDDEEVEDDDDDDSNDDEDDLIEVVDE